MAYSPISTTPIQYSKADGEPANGYYLKFYVANSTTPITMQTDSGGATSLAKCKLNESGYPISNPLDENTIFIPHLSTSYDAYRFVLYASAEDADANGTNGLPNIPSIQTPWDAARDFLNGVISSADIPFIQSGTGAVATTVQAKLREVEVSVTDFGAVGDGVTDDTAAIQAALDSGASSVKFPKPSVFYLVLGATDTTNSTVLDIPSNITLKGEGDSSVIKLGAHTTTAHRMFKISGKSNVVIKDLYLDGQKSLQTGASDEQSHGVLIYDSSKITIENCTFKNMKGDGVYVGGASNPGSTDILIDGNDFDANFRQCVSLVRGEFIRVIGNDLAGTTGNNPGAGIDIEANTPSDTLRQISIVGNNIRGNHFGMFINELAPAREVTVTGNTFSDNRATDLFCRGDNVSISGNVFYVDAKGASSPGPAIEVSLASNISITDNTIVGNYNANERGGIKILRDNTNIIISNNVISNTYNSGILLYHSFLSGGHSTGIGIYGNSLFNCVNAGLTAGAMLIQPDGGGSADIYDVEVIGNIVKDTRAGADAADQGLRIVNSTSAQLATWNIKDNIFTGTTVEVSSISPWRIAGKTLISSAALNFDLSAVTYQDLTMTVTGAALGDIVSLGIPNASASTDVSYTAWVSAADTVTVRAATSAAGPNPASGTFNVMITKLLGN